MTLYTMNNDTINLMNEVRAAHTNVKLMKQLLDTKQAAGPLPVSFLPKVSAAYEAYDVLVDRLIEATDGNASAAATDPLTYMTLQHPSASCMTYNEMASQQGQEELAQ